MVFLANWASFTTAESGTFNAALLQRIVLSVALLFSGGDEFTAGPSSVRDLDQSVTAADAKNSHSSSPTATAVSFSQVLKRRSHSETPGPKSPLCRI